MKRPRVIDSNFGKEIYERGYFSEGYYNYYEAFGLCQYLIWNLHYGFQKCKTYLTEFSKKADPSFNEIQSLEKIKTVIKRAEKKQPDLFPDIVVTEIELENIARIKDFKKQKFLFTLLVYSKRYKFDTTNKKKRKDVLGYHTNLTIAHNIAVDMGMKISLSKMPIYLREFYLLGLIEGLNYEKIKILFSDDSNKPVLEVLGNEYPWVAYLKLFDGEQIFCENCKKQEKRKFSNQKYCDDCRNIMQKERTRNRVKKHRNHQ